MYSSHVDLLMEEGEERNKSNFIIPFLTVKYPDLNKVKEEWRSQDWDVRT